MVSFALLRASCARTVSYYHLRVQGSSTTSLNRVEVAGLLSGLDSHETSLVLAKYCEDESAERALRAHVRLFAVNLALAEGWKIIKGRPIAWNMGALAVFEVISPGRCGRCNGTGIVKNHDCNTCNGSGFKPVSGRAKAAFIGVGNKEWREVWKDRYEKIFQYVLTIESTAKIQLAANTCESDEGSRDPVATQGPNG